MSIAGLAAAPAAALPAIAGASPEAADPIFAAFAEFERAKAADAAAWKSFNNLEEATWSALEAAGIKAPQLFSHQRLEALRELGLLSESDYAEALTALDGPESEHQAMWRAVEESDEAARATSEVRGEAERELLTTAPTTHAGALQLLGHLAELLSDDDVVNDLYVADVVGDAIRNAIAVFMREARS